jgi:hypothetical protein
MAGITRMAMVDSGAKAATLLRAMEMAVPVAEAEGAEAVQAVVVVMAVRP